MIWRRFGGCAALRHGWRRDVCTGRPVLGIETSCDDTGVAVVSRDAATGRGVVHSEVLRSQWDLVARYGGVFPNEARQAHAAAIGALVEEALRRAGLQAAELDAVSVTLGPGLSPCLAVGASAARELCRAHGLPLVGVNHLVAHALTPLMARPFAAPFLALLASGGHTSLLCARGDGPGAASCVDAARYEVLGKTLDDSVGEAFDKVWRLLQESLGRCSEVSPEQLARWRGGHGGAALEELAAEAPADATLFTVPLQGRGGRHGMDFSFSGLKTQVARHVERARPQSRAELARVAAAFQATAVQHLHAQLLRAVAHVRASLPQGPAAPPLPLVVSGGVASNKALRRRLLGIPGVELLVPPQALCVDNGVMIAWTGLLMRANGDPGLTTPAELDQMWFDPSWTLGPVHGIKRRMPLTKMI